MHGRGRRWKIRGWEEDEPSVIGVRLPKGLDCPKVLWKSCNTDKLLYDEGTQNRGRCPQRLEKICVQFSILFLKW